MLIVSLLSGCATFAPAVNDEQLVELIDALDCHSYQCEVIRCEAEKKWWQFLKDCSNIETE